MAEYGAQIGRTVEKESVRIFSPDELVDSISRLYSKYDSSVINHLHKAIKLFRREKLTGQRLGVLQKVICAPLPR